MPSEFGANSSKSNGSEHRQAGRRNRGKEWMEGGGREEERKERRNNCKGRDEKRMVAATGGKRGKGYGKRSRWLEGEYLPRPSKVSSRTTTPSAVSIITQQQYQNTAHGGERELCPSKP